MPEPEPMRPTDIEQLRGPPRPIYGTVRYMSYASTSRKFDSAAYISRMQSLADEVNP